MHRLQVVPPRIENIRKAFRMFDADGSGDIDASELRQCLKQLGMKVDPEVANETLAKYDEDGNGDLGFEEFEKLVAEISSKIAAELYKPQAGAVARLGTESEEALAFLEQIKLTMPEEVELEGSLTEAEINRRIGKAFRSYDKDGSGRMEAREIRACLRSMGVLVDEYEGQEVPLLANRRLVG